MKRRFSFFLVLSFIFILSAFSITASASGYPYHAYWDACTGAKGASDSAMVRMRTSYNGGKSWMQWQKWKPTDSGFDGAYPPPNYVSIVCYQAQIEWNGTVYATLYTSHSHNIDLANPRYTSVSVQNVTSDGYDVYIYGVDDIDPNGVQGSGVREVKISTDTGNNDAVRQEATNEGNGTWYVHVNAGDHGWRETGYTSNFYIYDNVGNCTSVNACQNMTLDTVPPVICYSPNAASWTNKAVPVTITCADTGSGIDHFTYQVSPDGGNTWGSSSTINGDTTTVNLNSNGTYEITTTAYDKAGNSTTQNSGLYYIDMTPPTATFNPNGCPWRNHAENVTITPSDSGGSGVASYRYRISTNGAWGGWTTLSGASQAVNVTAQGTNIIEVTVTDNAGNTATVDSSPYLLDLTPPTCATDNDHSTGQSATVNLSFADTGGSGLGSTYYYWSKSNTAEPFVDLMQSYNGSPVTENTNGTWYLWTLAYDHASNSTYKVFGPYKVSTIKPTINFEPNYSGWINHPITVTETPVDNGGVGIKYFSYQKSADYGMASQPGAKNI